MKKRKGFYSISVVAKMFSVHQQTVRMYEKEGLLTPKRSEGNTRLYSEEDVERLEEIINLTHKMGVNLAGVEIVMKLQKKIKRMQEDMNKMFSQLQGQLDHEGDEYTKEVKHSAERLTSLKKDSKSQPKNLPLSLDTKPRQSKDKEEKVDDWQIDYDENI